MIFAAIFLAIFAAFAVGATIRASQKNAVGAPSVFLGSYETALFAFMVSMLLFIGISISKIFSAESFSESGVYVSTVILQILFSVCSLLFARKAGVSITLGDIAVALRYGVAFFAVCASAVLACGVAISILYKIIFGESIEAQMAVEMFMNIDSIWVKVLAGVSIIILAPISEELFFRGLLYPSAKGWIAMFFGIEKNDTLDTFEKKFKLKVSTVSAAIIVSILFSLIHSSLFAALPIFLMGILLVCCYEKTNSILAPIIAHSLFNLANVLIILFQK